MKKLRPVSEDDSATEISVLPNKTEEPSLNNVAAGVELVINASGTIDAVIDEEVVVLAGKCRLFCNNGRPEELLPLVHRNEVMTGNFLGNGAFSECYQVWGFQFSTHVLKTEDPIQEEAREHLDETAIDVYGRSNFVIKHLRHDLHLRGRRKFVNAAADLVLEAKFLSHFDHHNIIKLHGWAGGKTQYHFGAHDSFFLILDRLDFTLAHRMLQWQMDPATKDAVVSKSLSSHREKIDIGCQIASALEYLHDRDIVFRDLKPDNIGFRGQTVKLFDFGLCRELPNECPGEDQVFHMSGVGTKRYMAPEVFMGENYNLKADVYSWAIVFYSMMSLEKPYEYYDAMLYKHLVCQEGIRPAVYQEWPEEVQDLCHRGWAQNHQDRPTIKEARQTLSKLCRKIREDEEEANKDIVEKSCELVDRICVTHLLCKDPKKKNGLNILRILERQMMNATSSSYMQERPNTSYPNHQHLRSSYL